MQVSSSLVAVPMIDYSCPSAYCCSPVVFDHIQPHHAWSRANGNMADATFTEPFMPAAFDLPDGSGSEEVAYPARPLHVLLATTGSVASIKAPLIVQGLLEVCLSYLCGREAHSPAHCTFV